MFLKSHDLTRISEPRWEAVTSSAEVSGPGLVSQDETRATGIVEAIIQSQLFLPILDPPLIGWCTLVRRFCCPVNFAAASRNIPLPPMAYRR